MIVAGPADNYADGAYVVTSIETDQYRTWYMVRTPTTTIRCALATKYYNRPPKVGDKVRVDISPYNDSHGRIYYIEPK